MLSTTDSCWDYFPIFTEVRGVRNICLGGVGRCIWAYHARGKEDEAELRVCETQAQLMNAQVWTGAKQLMPITASTVLVAITVLSLPACS